MYARRGRPSFRHTGLDVLSIEVGDNRYLHGTSQHLYGFKVAVPESQLNVLQADRVSIFQKEQYLKGFERGRKVFRWKNQHRSFPQTPRGVLITSRNDEDLATIITGRRWGVIDMRSFSHSLLHHALAQAPYSRLHSLFLVADDAQSGVCREEGFLYYGRELSSEVQDKAA